MRDIAIDKLGSDARRATLSSTGYGSNCKVKMNGFFGWYMRCITENSQRNQIEKPIGFFPKECMRGRLSLERDDLSRIAAPRAQHRRGAAAGDRRGCGHVRSTAARRCSSIKMADELGANSDTDSASDDLHVEVWDFDDRQPPLVEAAMLGHNAEVRSMLAEGADVNNVGVHGYSALTWASTCNHLEIATALLEHGSDVNKPTNIGVTPMSAPCALGNLAMAQLLSSYGAARTFTIDRTKWTAEEYATFTGHTALAAWLVSSRKWTTPLHHLTIIPATRAHALLRNGASILAAAAPGDPTPLSLARELHAKGEAAEGSAAALVLKAAAPWSRATHELFPDAARAHAVQILLVGHRLSRLPKYETVAQAVFDLWVDHVMQHMVARESE